MRHSMFRDCAMIQSAPTGQMYDPSFDPLAPLHLSHPCVSYRALSKTKAEKFSALQRKGRKGQTNTNISCQICPIPPQTLDCMITNEKTKIFNIICPNYTTFCPTKIEDFSVLKHPFLYCSSRLSLTISRPL